MGKTEVESILSTIDVWLLVFGIIVVVGVAGESIFGVRHWWNDRKLRVIVEREEKEKADELARFTSSSEVAITAANARAEEAQRTAESFKRDIATANERAAAAQELAARYNAIAEQEKLERIKLQEKFAPRSLTGGQRQSLINSLAQYSGATVGIIAVNSGAELNAFSRILKEVFEAAGWKVSGPTMAIGGMSGAGISVVPQKDAGPEIEQRIYAVYSALGKVGISAGRGDAPTTGPVVNTNTAPITLYVGEKP